MDSLYTNCTTICNSPLNNSKSKMQYSFPKQSRFRTCTNEQNDKFYDIPLNKSSRKAGIGYGTKYDFTKETPKTPAPGKYDRKSLWLIKRINARQKSNEQYTKICTRSWKLQFGIYINNSWMNYQNENKYFRQLTYKFKSTWSRDIQSITKFK